MFVAVAVGVEVGAIICALALLVVAVAVGVFVEVGAITATD